MMTLADFELGKRTPYDRTLADIRRALEGGGVQFLDGNGHGPGVAPAKPDDAPNGKSKSATTRGPRDDDGFDAIGAFAPA
jgi:hypothetical protein